MNNRNTKIYEMCLRVQEYHTVLAAKIPDDSYAAELFTRLGQLLMQLETHATAQSSNTRAVSESVTSKEAARTALRAKLEAVSRTARPLEKTMPGIADKFRIPVRLKDQDLLSFARSVILDAASIKAELVKRGLAATILEDIAAAATAFEQSVGRRIQNKESRVASTANVNKLLQDCMHIVREIDAIIRNLCADDVAAIAAWQSASRVERHSRRTKSDGNRTAQTPTPAQ
jgi:predicted nucleic acid-binding protein